VTAAGLGPGEFAWAAGIEDTCVYPPEHFAMADLDEYDLTDHTGNWREDLRSVRDLGATVLRYGVNWPLVHTAPGVFDWSMLDERLHYASAELGLTVIADLVHYGTPTWLSASFADAGYPQTVAEFAGAFAARYRGIVDHVTPLNEPLTTASFCGLRGVWPPSLTGWDGWTAVTLGVVEGMAETIRAVRAANPDAVVVHVEASSLYRTDDAGLAEHAALLEAVGMLPTDLLLGRVDLSHPLHAWLLEQGADPERLERLTVAPPTVDLLGVNYYPDLSPRTLVQRGDEVAQVATNRWSDGLADSLRAFSARYGLPMLITETSIEGDDDVRSAWLDDSVRSIGELRAEGLDIRGYTWWPVFDFVDWSYASGGRNVEEFVVDDDIVAARQHSGDGAADGRRAKSPFLRRMGVIRLDEQEDGRLARVPTAAAELYARLASESAAERTGTEVADELAS